MTPRVLVIQHEDTCPPGLFGPWLRDEGIDLDVRRGHRGEVIPASLREHDGLLVLGGPMGANDDADHPWLPEVKRLLRQSIESPAVILGICLGHQLLATALGGTSAPNPCGKARGLTPYRPTPEGRSDPLMSSAEPGSLGIQWNNDIVTALPPGATALATAPDDSLQATRFGARAWGVQFHPEATESIFRSWEIHRSGGTDPERQDTALHTAADELHRHRDEVVRAWEPLARRFAAIVTAEHPGALHPRPAGR